MLLYSEFMGDLPFDGTPSLSLQLCDALLDGQHSMINQPPIFRLPDGDHGLLQRLLGACLCRRTSLGPLGDD